MHRLAVECLENVAVMSFKVVRDQIRQYFQTPAVQQIVNEQLVPENLQDLNQTGYYVQHIAAERKGYGDSAASYAALVHFPNDGAEINSTGCF